MGTDRGLGACLPHTCCLQLQGHPRDADIFLQQASPRPPPLAPGAPWQGPHPTFLTAGRSSCHGVPVHLSGLYQFQQQGRVSVPTTICTQQKKMLIPGHSPVYRPE